MLVEIHILQNHAPSNLNRDDSGSPKECIFGGVTRARISSQCLKRSIRRSEGFQAAMEGHLASRTRRLPELVRDAFINAKMSPEIADIAAKKASGFGTKEGKEQAAGTDGKYATAQTMFLTQADIDAVTETLLTSARKESTAAKFDKVSAKDLQAEAAKAGFRPVSVDIALFGRMITSGAFRDVQASCQVAHALSTHKVDHEYDYFTAVDDLRNPTDEVEEDAGADMIGDVEFNSACYYKYFSVDVQGLRDNLTGTRLGKRSVTDTEMAKASELATAAVVAFLRSAIETTPTGKQNTFAAHQLPAAVLVEVRPRRVPVSYANAFVNPVKPNTNGGLVSGSLDALKSEVEAINASYNLESESRLLLAPGGELNIQGVESVPDLNTLCKKLSEALSHA